MNILKDNGKYFFYNNLEIGKKLEPKNYLFNYNDLGLCWLEDVEDFKFPSKIYNVDTQLRSLVRKSFDNSVRNLGVLLTGNKGQGKSLTAKLICKELNLPVILINKSIDIDINFVNFLNNIKQDYILFVDEFEKLFADSNGRNSNEKAFHDQESFLTFMDGVLTNTNKILFLLTTNDRVNEFFINRPSRIKFLQEYDELPEELFHMIVDDKLIHKEFKNDLEENISLVNLNIDLLISIVEDVNLFNIPFSSFKNHYNYKFENYRYEVLMVKDGSEHFEKIVTVDKKPKAIDRYLLGYIVTQIIKFEKEEILFTTTHTTWDDDDNEKNEIKTIKAVPLKMGGFKTYSF